MTSNTRSVLSSWFSSEERPATGHGHQEAPDYVYAPVHPTLAKKLEKRGAGRGRGAPYGSKAPRSAGPSPIRPNTSGRPYHAAVDEETAVTRGPRRQLRSSQEDDQQRFFQEPGVKVGRNYNTEAFDYNTPAAPGGEPSWRAARSLPSSASSTPKKSFQASKQRRSRFKEYLSPEEVEKGLKDGTLLQGVLRVNHKRMRLAYVSVEGFDKDILIDGVFARNRAFEGDVVVIRLNDPSEWEVVKVDKDDEDDDEAEPADADEDEDEVDDDLIKPALDDSLVDVMTDTDDDEVAESDSVSVKTTAAEESAPLLADKVPDYEEGLDSEAATNAAPARGWWQPSASAAAEVAVEIEGAAATTTTEPATTVSVVVDSQSATPRAKGKRCWRCQEVGHISRDCTNKSAEKTPVKEKKEKPQAAKKEKPAKEPVEIKEGEETKLRRTAKVVAIAKHNHVEEMVGYLKPCGLAEEELGRGNFFAFFVPLEKRMPRILVPVKRLSASIISHPNELTTNLFVCKLTGWPASSGHPRGELVKNMGPSGDMEVELRVLLQDNNIDWEDSFAPEVLACLPQIPPPPARWEIPAEEYITRKDLRKERIFTIDPATAKDMDDAVSCKRLPDGTYLVGVHIADVTYFVKAGTPLDEDAKMRATTVYMVHRSIPMLPRLLSDNMCSLVPGEDRLSFSVTWRMDQEGNVLEEPWFGRTIIRSCVKMSYEAAQEMLDNRFTPPAPEPAPEPGAKPVVKRGSIFVKDPTAPEHRVEDIIEDVKVLNGMAESLRKKRFEDGSLTLDDAKMYFCLDDDKMPIDVGVYVRTASHFLIEEFMLLANKSVAKRIHAAFPDRALLRRHPAPNVNKLAEFITMCSTNSIDFDTSSSKGFQRSLIALNSLPNPDIAAVVTRLAMKPMSVAKYTCTDDGAEEGAYRHYALAFDHYTHFTSPIRRYADVIVHRLLDACLKGQSEPLEKDDLAAICDNCNTRKTKADKAQDKCDLVFLCTLLKNHPPKDLEATVITVNSRSFEVYVPLYGVEKLARAEDLPLAKLDHDKKSQALYLHWRAAEASAPSDAPPAADQAAEKPKKVIVQEIKPFTRLRVRLYPDLQRRPIDVRLAIVPPEGAAVPDNYYDAPVQESAARQPKTPAKQHGRKQPQPQPQAPPRPDHQGSEDEHHVEKWINEARDDEAEKRKQIAELVEQFVNDATQTKLHLPAELSSFERLIAHEIADEHGLHHQSSNFFCSETGTKERRLTLFKQPRPTGVRAGRVRSRSVPGGATPGAPNADPATAGTQTPTRAAAKKKAFKPKPAARVAPADGASPTPAAAGEPSAAADGATPKKRPVRKTKVAAKERAAVVRDQLEAAAAGGGDDGGAPAEVRTKVHRPKRTPKKRPVPAPAPTHEAQQGQEPQHSPEEAA